MKATVRAALFLVLLGLTPAGVRADSIQPIVPVGGVLYGSAHKTIVSSNTAVYVDTQTLKFYALKDVQVSSLTFMDGTRLTSTNSITSPAVAWGAITGTLSNQTDLQTKFNTVGTATNTLNTSIIALGASTGTLATSLVNLGASTGTLAINIVNLGASTGTLLTTINAVIVSTGALQAQVNAIATSTGVLSVSTTAIQTQLTSVSTNSLTLSSGTATYLQLSSATKTYANVSNFANATSTGVLSATDWNTFNNKGVGTITNVVPGPGIIGGGGAGAVTVSVSSVSLSSQVVGNIPMTNINSGTGASSLTFLRGDGTWVTPPGASGASSLSIFNNGTTLISSPTLSVNADSATILAINNGTSSATFKVNGASVTLVGNVFNGPGNLVKLTAGTQYPAVDGNLITNVNASALSGNVPIANLGNAIENRSTLQAGSTFYITSGTVTGQLTVGTYQGGGLTSLTCGDSTHAVSVTGGVFSCQAIAGTNGGQVSLSSGIVTPAIFVTSVTVNSSMTLTGPLSVVGTGDGGGFFSIKGSTYNITTSSNIGTGKVTVGDIAVFSSTSGTLADGGAPGSSGSSNLLTSTNIFSGGQTFTSVAVSSFSYGVQVSSLVLKTANGGVRGGHLEFWNGGNGEHAISFYDDAGSNNEGFFDVVDNGWLKFDLHNNNQFRIATASADHLWIAATTDGNMGIGGGGFVPAAGSAQVSIIAPTDDIYGLNVASSTTAGFYGVTVSSQSELGLFSRTSAQIKTTIPSPGKTGGQMFYCSDCATVPVCLSTGTAIGAFSIITNKTTACQ